MEQETWKDIEGYEALYQVSDIGRVRSLDRFGKGRGDVQSRRVFHGQILLQPIYRDLYPSVSLCKNGKVKRFYTHRLVALAFNPNPSGKPQINHINGVKTDNRAENLEWCTTQENSMHSCESGLSKVGVKHYLAKFTEDQVRAIRSDRRTQEAIAIEYGVCVDTIYKLRNRITYKSVA